MRLWSLHPKYLDVKGLVGLWREGLLARAVLKGETKGYVNHPQLERFKKQSDPVSAIDTYLFYIYEEARNRGYNFHKNKIGTKMIDYQIKVTDGQIDYELDHLKSKLKLRDFKKYIEIVKIESAIPNPIFKVVKGKVEGWERH